MKRAALALVVSYAGLCVALVTFGILAGGAGTGSVVAGHCRKRTVPQTVRPRTIKPTGAGPRIDERERT